MCFTLLHFYKILFVSDMFRMLAVKVCFTSLKYMVLKALVRTSSFRLINLLYKISFIFCCKFLRDQGKHLFVLLDKTVHQVTFCVILDQLLHFYCIGCIPLYGFFYRVTLLVNSICFQCLRRTSVMILNTVLYSITL